MRKTIIIILIILASILTATAGQAKALKITGGGQIDMDNASFGFEAGGVKVNPDGTYQGNLLFIGHSSGLKLKIDDILIFQCLEVNMTTGKCYGVLIEGNATVNKSEKVYYSLEVWDLEKPQKDYFDLWIYNSSGELTYMAYGDLTGGQVTIHGTETVGEITITKPIIALTTDKVNVKANGRAGATLTATVTLNNLPVADGTEVLFSTNLGVLSNTMAETVNGIATVKITSTIIGVSEITAYTWIGYREGYITDSEQVNFINKRMITIS